VAQQAYQPQPGAIPQQAIAIGPPKSKIAAALLAFFLGCLGIHNFYLGYTGRGVAQLLITLLGSCAFGIGAIITWIWSFIEFILILTGSLRDKFGRPLA
jgi:TM2 domain-containing membrane protein YozV